jgi:hypothetical protein
MNMYRTRHQLKNDKILRNAGKENDYHFSHRTPEQKRQLRRARTQESSNRLFSAKYPLRPPTAPLTRRGNIAIHDYVWQKRANTRVDRPETDLPSQEAAAEPSRPLSRHEASTRLALGAGMTVERYSAFETHIIARGGKAMNAKARRIQTEVARESKEGDEAASTRNFAVDRPDLLPVFYPQLTNATSTSSTVRTRAIF